MTQPTGSRYAAKPLLWSADLSIGRRYAARPICGLQSYR